MHVAGLEYMLPVTREKGRGREGRPAKMGTWGGGSQWCNRLPETGGRFLFEEGRLPAKGKEERVDDSRRPKRRGLPPRAM